MIEFIRVRGFQSHVDTYVKLSKGMTAITGLSMDGKTALLRGFKWAKDNRPTGSKFRYKYEDIDTIIDIGVDDHVISHIKSSKALNKEGHKALYIIQYPSKETKEFSAYGTAVPEEITSILNISDICIQNQLDPYMLVLSTSGQIATTINKITGIDASDKWIKEIKKALNTIKAESAVLKKTQKTLAEELIPFDGIDEIQSLILEASRAQDEYDKILRDCNQILDLVDVINASTVKLNAEKSVLNDLKVMLATDTQLTEEIARINKKNQHAVDISINIEKKERLKAQKEVLNPLIQDIKNIDKKMLRIWQIQETAKKIENTKLSIMTKIDIRDISKGEYIKALFDNGKCYVCGSKFESYEKLRDQI